MESKAMENFFKNKDEETLKKISQQALIAKAKADFGDKPFIDEYKPMYNLARYGGIVLQVVTALLSASWFYGRFVVIDGLPYASGVSVLMTFIICVLIEVLKRFTLYTTTISIIANSYNPKKSIAYGSLVTTLAISVLGIYSTVEGGRETTYKLADKTTVLSSEYEQKVSAIKAEAKAALLREDKKEADYKSSVSWKGKIDASNKTTQRKIDGFTAERLKINKQLEKDLAKLDSDYATALTDTKKSATYNATAVLCLSLAMELASYLCIIFIAYFRSCLNLLSITKDNHTPTQQATPPTTKKEQPPTTESQPQKEATPQRAIGFFPHRNDPTPHATTPPPSKPIISSEASNTHVNTHINTPINTPNEQDVYVLRQGLDVEGAWAIIKNDTRGSFLRKYEKETMCILSGKSIKDAMRINGVSKSTIQSIKRILAEWQILELKKVG